MNIIMSFANRATVQHRLVKNINKMLRTSQQVNVCVELITKYQNSLLRSSMMSKSIEDFKALTLLGLGGAAVVTPSVDLSTTRISSSFSSASVCRVAVFLDIATTQRNAQKDIQSESLQLWLVLFTVLLMVILIWSNLTQ